jgi:Pyruvate/2-oxoacid:ferredoxin oxidoreductase delta subunit
MRTFPCPQLHRAARHGRSNHNPPGRKGILSYYSYPTVLLMGPDGEHDRRSSLGRGENKHEVRDTPRRHRTGLWRSRQPRRAERHHDCGPVQICTKYCAESVNAARRRGDAVVGVLFCFFWKRTHKNRPPHSLDEWMDTAPRSRRVYQSRRLLELTLDAGCEL